MNAAHLDASSGVLSRLNTPWGREYELDARIAGRPLIATVFNA